MDKQTTEGMNMKSVTKKLDNLNQDKSSENHTRAKNKSNDKEKKIIKVWQRDQKIHYLQEKEDKNNLRLLNGDRRQWNSLFKVLKAIGLNVKSNPKPSNRKHKRKSLLP